MFPRLSSNSTIILRTSPSFLPCSNLLQLVFILFLRPLASVCLCHVNLTSLRLEPAFPACWPLSTRELARCLTE